MTTRRLTKNYSNVCENPVRKEVTGSIDSLFKTAEAAASPLQAWISRSCLSFNWPLRFTRPIVVGATGSTVAGSASTSVNKSSPLA
ncbi:hypothetical protein T03_9913 [Trichinella britovi]|uniref:Uncharacterized protein n=1 Tax=Trichinella britovi TaxID=45882 RepID=A0A0V1CP93_TRIBR|nr:hypothetical protein T03_9913 [Trichinella britovi]